MSRRKFTYTTDDEIIKLLHLTDQVIAERLRVNIKRIKKLRSETENPDATKER